MHFFFKINADPKREIGWRSFPDRPPFCFLLGMVYNFFNDCLLVGKKKTTELYSFTKREPVLLGKRRNQTHLA